MPRPPIPTTKDQCAGRNEVTYHNHTSRRVPHVEGEASHTVTPTIGPAGERRKDTEPTNLRPDGGCQSWPRPPTQRRGFWIRQATEVGIAECSTVSSQGWERGGGLLRNEIGREKWEESTPLIINQKGRRHRHIFCFLGACRHCWWAEFECLQLLGWMSPVARHLGPDFRTRKAKWHPDGGDRTAGGFLSTQFISWALALF
jgi:hypothetical protein